MSHIFRILMFTLFLAGASFAAKQHVAVLETVADSKDIMSPSERRFLTDMLRTQAVKELPAEREFVIMTRENIQMMLPPGKAIEDCEGSCLAETGKNIQADFVAQARIGQVGANISISVELYETAGSKLVASFTGLGADVNALIEVIKANSPEFFRKVRGNASGIMRTGFDSADNQSFVVNVSTNPQGASLSIDGRPVRQCMSTPCQIMVDAGEHRFVAVLDHHDDAEGTFTVSGNGQEISLDLAPRYGTLNLNLAFPTGGSYEELKIKVDGELVPASNKVLVDPGTHDVSIAHRCYNPVNFKVGVFRDKEETFKESLQPVMGGLSLKARSAEGEEIILPVYANGEKIGETPYVGSVPVCAQLAIGEAPSVKPLELNIVQGDVLNYEYVEPPQQGGSTAKRRRANAGVNNATTTPERGTSIPTNVSTSSSSSSSTSLSDIAEWLLPLSAIIAGVGLGIGIAFELDAEEQYNSANAENYEEKMDAAKSSQTIRNIGWGVTAVGGLGFVLATTFLIVDF